jgi:hypothetical protein
VKDDPKLRPLTPAEAKCSLAARLSKTVDKARQIEVRLGLRPYQVFLTWTTWDGDERGDGIQRVVARVPMTPTPIVSDLTALRQNAFSAGRALVGDLRLTGVSAQYPLEVLLGNVIPDRGQDEVPEPFHFFYEVVEDGRHCPPAGGGDERKRFSLAAAPFLDAENQQWILVLDKMSGDMQRDGTPQNEPAKPIVDPWRKRRIEPPPSDDDF